jgi:hypothetical protein
VRVSEERVRQIAERVVDVLYDDEHIDYDDRLDSMRVCVQKAILADLAFEDRISQEATETLKTYSRDIVHGTAEWMILYEKTREDLAIKYNYYLR